MMALYTLVPFLLLIGWSTICEAQCPDVILTNATVGLSDPSRMPGSNVTVICDDGFVISTGVKNRTSVCGSDMNWTPGIPNCIDRCPNPILSNAIVEPNDYDRMPGTSVTVNCDDGFVISPGVKNMTSVCGSDMNWAPGIPSCIAQCPHVVLTNAAVNLIDSNRMLGANATVTCDTGFVISTGVKSMTLECDSDKTWTPEIPSCGVIDCGNPDPGENAVMTFENQSLGQAEYGQVAVYTCISGHYFATVYRLDLAEIVKATCSDLGQWEPTMGYNYFSILDQYVCYEYDEYHGCREVNETLTIQMEETQNSALANKGACRAFCLGHNKIFVARQGDTCYCLDNLRSELRDDLECNTLCHDNLSYCGRTPDRYSVFSTPWPCVKIDSSYSLPGGYETYTELTCQQLCRGLDKPLSFYRGGMSNCICLDSIPTYTEKKMSVCNSLISEPDYSRTGELFITETLDDFDVNSCSDIFGKGVFYHGHYYLSNGTKIYCNFFDNSTTCEPNWIAYQDNCYKFQSNTSSMDEQFENCQAQNSHLVSIGDENEWGFIETAMNSMGYMQNKPVYIGLYDTQQTFSYMWTDETAVIFRKFKRSFPQNIVNQCVVYSLGWMKNVDCTSSQGAICEKSKAAVGCASVDSLTYPDPQVTSAKMSTPVCFESCRSAGFNYSLTRDTDCFCQNDIDGYTLTSWSSCSSSCPGNKYQMCGSNETDHVTITADVGQPYRDGCRAMILGSLETNVTIQNDNGSLEVIDCDVFAGVFCPESWIEINGRCYRFFLEPIQDVTYMCSTIGGYVAVYETETEADSVLHIIQSTPILAAIDSWLFGLFRHRKEDSKVRFANGAFVNDSLRELAEGIESTCFAHNSSDANNITGVFCGSSPYICETGPDYLGCYWAPDPSAVVISLYGDMSITQCRETCKETGKSLAGIRKAKECNCLDANEIVKAESETKCQMHCGEGQMCGANNYVTVFDLDFDRNATSCEELFNQGVMLTGHYTVDGVSTWCGMKNSSYLAEQAELHNSGRNSEVDFDDLDWNRVGLNDQNFAVDIRKNSHAATLDERCIGLYEPSCIVATLRDTEGQELIRDVLKWSGAHNAEATFIGLVDEFYIGSYTWSDGSLFRLTDVNISTIPETVFTDPSKAVYVQMNSTGDLLFDADQDEHHVVCQRDTSYLGCYELSVVPLPYNIFDVSGYSSMSLTLCRQVCQGQRMPEMLITGSDCICYKPTHDSDDIINHFVASNNSACDVACQGNRLQICGNSNYYRRYTVTTDVPESCQVLYDNFVLLPSYYLVNGSREHCGVDDKSVYCPAGFIANVGKCYRFQRRRDTNIKKAASTCFSQSSYLASPTNETDIENIVGLIKMMSALQTTELWAVGLYSHFKNGRFTSAVGHMISENSSMVAHLDPTHGCVALNVTSGRLVTVSCTAVLPFICETSEIFSGCQQVDTSKIISTLNLEHGLSVQQCVAFCKGLNVSHIIALTKETECACTDDYDALVGYGVCATKCTGQFHQSCGSNDAYSVYYSDNYPVEYIQHSCNDYVTFGVVHPTVYLTDTSDFVTCFKYSNQSDLILATISNLQVVTSASESSYSSQDAQMNLREMDLSGWVGASGTDVFIEFKLQGYFIIEGIIVQGNIQNISIMTSIDGSFYESHPDNVIEVPPSPPDISWIGLAFPVVASHVKIYIDQWEGSQPSGSAELVGYSYAHHDFSNHYLGCHRNISITNSSDPMVGLDFETCRAVCSQSGFSHLLLESPDICQCTNGSTPRDFIEDGCKSVCFGNLRCASASSSGEYAVYTLTDFTCPLVSVNNSDMAIAAVVNGSSNDSYTVLTTLTFNCILGHEIAALGASVQSTCSNFKQWTLDVDGHSCERVNCGNYPVVPNAEIIATDDNSTLYGDKVQYSCRHGSQKFDGTIDIWNMTCMETKRWLPTAKQCETVQCLDNPPTVSNAVSNNSLSEYVHNTVIAYTCDDYHLFPSDNTTEKYIECLLSGQWSTIEPFCERYYCSPLPPAIPNAAIIRSNDSNVATYSCIGDTLFSDKMAEKVVKCNATTFQWDDVEDVCQNLRKYDVHVCLSKAHHQVTNPAENSLVARSLIDCATKCMDNAFCLSYNYRKHHPGSINCKVFIESVGQLTFVEEDTWDVFSVSADYQDCQQF